MPQEETLSQKISHMSPEEQSRFTSGLHTCTYGADTEGCLHSRTHRGDTQIGKKRSVAKVLSNKEQGDIEYNARNNYSEVIVPPGILPLRRVQRESLPLTPQSPFRPSLEI